MDGVLIDSEPLHYESDLMLLQEMNITVDKHYLDQFVGMTNPEMWKCISKQNEITINIQKVLRKQLKIKIMLLKKYNYKAIDGVIDLLSNIRKKNIPIAVASSSSPLFIKRALLQIKVKKYIKKMISGESVPKGKPEPDIFIEVAKLLQVNPSQCLVIEDSRNGVRAAKKAGMKVIGYQNINSGEQDLSEANLIVSDYANFDINQILLEEFI